MRYLRKLLIMTAALAAVAAITATTASAEVQVTCDDDCQIELEGYVSVERTDGLGSVTCRLEMQGDVSLGGEVSIHNVDSWAGDSYCPSYMSDCGNYGWIGQIVGPGDEAYTGTDDYEVLMYMCFSPQWVWHEVRWGIDSVEPPPPYEHLAHLTWSLPEQNWDGITTIRAYNLNSTSNFTITTL